MTLAEDFVPVAVSPGSERGVARVGDRCPTFSWSAIAWAAGYRVVVFEGTTAEIAPYESMVSMSVPVLSRTSGGRRCPGLRPKKRADGRRIVYLVRPGPRCHGERALVGGKGVPG